MAVLGVEPGVIGGRGNAAGAEHLGDLLGGALEGDVDDRRPARALSDVLDEDLLTHLVWSGASRLVRDTWVGGRQVVRDGVCTTVDAEELRADVAERALALVGVDSAA